MGSLVRFDPRHPETNGMVDYFASRMDGIRKYFSLSPSLIVFARTALPGIAC